MRKILLLMSLGAILCSCNATKKILYLQDMQPNSPEAVSAAPSIVVAPMDVISIVVSSKDPQLAALFNLQRSTNSIGGGEANNNNGELLGYTIDGNGNIDFPVLGYLHVAGMTRNQIALMIKQQLIDKDLIKDPIVTVDFKNLSFSVIGEVGRPGKYNIDRDRVTLLDALSTAGDITILAKRDGVIVIREKDGVRSNYRVDMRSKDMFSSPAFYLQQNDIVYVEPSKMRANQSTVNNNNVVSVPFWMSLASFLLTIGLIAFN